MWPLASVVEASVLLWGRQEYVSEIKPDIVTVFYSSETQGMLSVIFCYNEIDS